MIIPDAAAKKALFIIDVQPSTFTGKIPPKITNRIIEYIGKTSYDAIVIAEYYADEVSMFFKQQNTLISKEATGCTDHRITELLRPYAEKLFTINKTTRSCFKGFEKDNLIKFLEDKKIEEIHTTGFDINDCVLATTYEAIDLGYYSFLLEELSHHNSGDQEQADAALHVLRSWKMTNNSLHKKINYSEIDLEQ